MSPAASNPSLSVVIPTCNRNDLLARVLAALSPAVQNVSPEKYEVIVSDDGRGSTGEQMISARFPWARWVRGPARGPAANRNNGARAARGEWLLFTDDDCVPDPGWLDAFAGAIASGKARVYEGRTNTEVIKKGPFWGAPVNETGGLLWSCNMAVQRDLFFALGGFDDLFPYPHLEDVDFRERLKTAGHPFVFCREAIVCHPLRPVSSATRQAMGHESYFYYARKHGLTLSGSGLSVRAFVLARVRCFVAAGGFAQRLRFVARSFIEALLVITLSPWWLWKFRSVKPQP